MAEIQELVNMDELKAQFPDTDESILREAVQNEGMKFADEKAEEPAQEQPAEPVQEVKTEEEPLPEPDAEKRVPLKALQEEREKRQKASAELLQLKAELEKMRQVQPATPTQPAQQPAYQPPTQQPPMQPQDDAEARFFAMLTDEAESAVMKTLHLTEADMDALQFTDRKKFNQFQAMVSARVQEKAQAVKTQFESQQQNQRFANTLRSDPLFQPVYSFYRQEIEELPVKQAKSILEAEARIANNRGTVADRELVWAKYNEYKQKFVGLTKTPAAQPAAPVAAATQVDDKISQAANHPRTGMLGGSAGSSGMALAEMERLIEQGRGDLLPADALQRVLQGR